MKRNSTLDVVMGNLVLYDLLKRIIDILGSSLGLLILSPIIICVVLFIKIEEPFSPILFTQNRVGKKQKIFKIYKFRSMETNAESQLEKLKNQNEVQGAMFKMKNDPRVTQVGKFIRKTSLDELPQLLNVLKGEMSLVGPRPPLLSEVEEYSSRDLQRLNVKPGCSGLWQVSGRNNVDFDDMVNLDLEYIRERSLRLDFLIMIKTIKIMILPKGAY